MTKAQSSCRDATAAAQVTKTPSDDTPAELRHAPSSSQGSTSGVVVTPTGCQTSPVEHGDLWQLIDQARAAADTGGRPPTGTEIGQRLTDLLSGLSLTEILEFDRVYGQIVADVDRWEFCAACFLISGYLSDDTFTDFKAGLIGLGRDTFYRILIEPDEVADVSVVQAVAAEKMGPMSVHAESIQFAAANAYTAHTGDDDDFWEALDARPAPPGDNHRRDDWSGRFGPEDLSAIPARLPRLAAMFPRQAGILG